MNPTRTDTKWRRLVAAEGRPVALLREILARLHYCRDDLEAFRIVDAESERPGIEFTVADGREPEPVETILEGLVDSIAEGWVATPQRISFDRRDRAGELWPEAIDELIATGELAFPGPGRASLSGRALLLREALDRLVLRIAEEVDAEPHGYPSVISVDALERCDYFASFPQYLTFATHLREDLGTLRAFVDRVRHGSHVDGEAIGQLLAPPREVLSPTVCFHCYEQLQDRVLPADGGPARTARNRCYRYEAGNLTGLERLWEFSMREIVFFGPPARVREQLDVTRRATEALVDRLELAAWIENAHDAFFIDDFAAKSSFQSAFDLKHELRMPLEEGSLAVASWNFHNDFFSRAYGISLEGGATASSGCLGFGLERLVQAILLQKGADPDSWPEALREEMY